MSNSELKMYHVAFYSDSTTYVLSCYNIEATSMAEAINSHYAKFPTIEPLYIMHKKK
jgi:hypothetical protein